MQQRSLTILSCFRRRIDCCDDTEVRIRNHRWQTSEIRDQKNNDISNQRDWSEFYRQKEAQIDHDLACFECSKIQFWSSLFSEFLSRKWNKKERQQYDRRKDKSWDRDDAQSMQ